MNDCRHGLILWDCPQCKTESLKDRLGDSKGEEDLKLPAPRVPAPRSAQLNDMLDNLALESYGIKRSDAIRAGTCVSCKKSADGLRAEKNAHEYTLSGLCQICQDAVFRELGDYVHEDRSLPSDDEGTTKS